MLWFSSIPFLNFFQIELPFSALTLEYLIVMGCEELGKSFCLFAFENATYEKKVDRKKEGKRNIKSKEIFRYIYFFRNDKLSVFLLFRSERLTYLFYLIV